MKKEVSDKIEEAFSEGSDEKKIKAKLFSQGISQKEIDTHFERKLGARFAPKKNQFSALPAAKSSAIEKEVYTKEMVDRFTYSFTSHQFLYIILNQLGASIFFIPLLAGARSLFGIIGEFFTRAYQEMRGRIIMFKYAGIYLAFCFLGIAYSIATRRLLIMGLFIAASFFFVMAYSESYKKSILLMFNETKRREVISKASALGIFFVIAGLVCSAFLLDSGYLFGINTLILVFVLAALMMVISSAFSYHFYTEEKIAPKKPFLEEIRHRFLSMYHDFKDLIKNPTILLFFLASSLSVLVYTVGNAFYGIFIYDSLYNSGFTGFKNVAFVFIMAAIASVVAPSITKRNVFAYGKFPMLVFGTLLTAIMPLSFYYKPTILSVSMGVILGTLGFSISGFASGLLASSMIPEEKKKSYFSISSIIGVLPYIIMMPLAGLVALKLGLSTLFLILTLILAVIVTPAYLYVIAKSQGKKV